MPLVALGPVTFSSGYNPVKIDGPKRTTYVVEHEIPAKEGGVVEYVGSKQPDYQIKGFLAPLNDVFNGAVAANLSGVSYVGLNADDAMKYINGIRGSGPLLLKDESAWSNYSGYSVFYENDFFYITSLTFAMEGGRGYPYYPYTIDLKRASTKTYGATSGALNFPNAAPYFSGYAHFVAGKANGEAVAGAGIYVPTVASGNARMGLLTTAYQLLAESAAQPVTSGWNYFPLNPTLNTTSGIVYILGFMGDATNRSGYTIQIQDAGGTSKSYRSSGVAFASGFSSVPTVDGPVSGITEVMVIVVPG